MLDARCLLVLLPLLFHTVTAVQAGHSNSLMDISADGRLLACSNRDSGTVTVIELDDYRKVHEIPVGKKPEGVTFIGSTHQLAVAVYAEDQITILDGDEGKLIRRLEVFDEPYGIVSTRSGDSLFVTLDFPGEVVEIETSSMSIKRSLKIDPFIRGIALAPDEQRLYVTGFYTTNVYAVQLPSGELEDQWNGIANANLARQLVVHPNRPKAYLPHIRSIVTAIRGDASIFPYISIVDTYGGEGRRRKRVPMDAFRGNLVTANPWEVAIAPDGKQLYAVFSGTNDLFACNVLDDDYREIDYRAYRRVGQNPRAVRVSPDGERFFVYNALDFNVVAYDAESVQPVKTIPVCDNPLDDDILLGKQLFYSALQPMVGRRWISCSSCHPDGDPDGRTWHNPEGLRNTQSLAGLAWTHPVHWSADRDEVQDFEHTIRGKLMQGRGLIQGRLESQLGQPIKGQSEQLDALAAYANSHQFTLSPFAKNGLSPSALRGKELFFHESTRCAQCHSGPLYTDSIPRAPDEIVRHDVGTGNDDPSEKMGPAYDTPTLLGVYRTAPYLHHGRAETLVDVLTKFNRNDQHGKTSHLSAEEIQDLASFLQSLPYESYEEQAESAGLPRIR